LLLVLLCGTACSAGCTPWCGKDLEGSGHSRVDVGLLSQHLPGVSEEYHEDLGEAGSFRAQGRSGSRLEIERIAVKHRRKAYTELLQEWQEHVWNVECGICHTFCRFVFKNHY